MYIYYIDILMLNYYNIIRISIGYHWGMIRVTVNLIPITYIISFFIYIYNMYRL